GGAAAAGAAVSTATVSAELDVLRAALDDPSAQPALDRAEALLTQLNDRQSAQQEFADQIRSTLPKAAAGREDASATVFALPGVELMQRLSRPIMPTPSPSGSGGVTGGATALPNLGALPGVSSLLSGIHAAA